MGKGLDIPWVGGRYILDREVDILWIVEVNIPWVWGSNYNGQVVNIPWIRGSKYHG